KSTLSTHTLFYYVHAQTIRVFTTKANNLSLSLTHTHTLSLSLSLY